MALIYPIEVPTLRLARIFRFLSAAHIVDEVGAGQYCANKMTHTLADEMMEAVMIHSCVSLSIHMIDAV